MLENHPLLTETSLTSLWKNIVTDYGLRIALSESSTDITYLDLNDRALKIASWLQKHDVKGQCIVISIESKIDSVVALLGVLLAGNHYFYIAPGVIDTFENQILAADGTLVLTDGFTPKLQSVESVTLSAIFETATPAYTDVLLGDHDPFVIFSTSGSTGQPKLVRHCTRYILDDTLGQIRTSSITADDVRDYGGTLMFSASLGAIFPILLAGGRLIFYPMSERGPMALCRFWLEHRITLTTVPVSVLRALAKSDSDLTRLDAMRIIIVSAEAASGADFELFAQKLPKHLLLMNGYATTETRNITLAVHNLSRMDTDLFGSVGRSWNGRKILIQNEQGEELPIGETGEIVVEAPYLPHEYLNNPLESNRAFTVLINGDIQFRTGDIGYFTPGKLLILTGRKDSIVKINGIKVNLESIEVRLNKIEETREAAVVMNKNRRIEAFISLASGFDLSNLKKSIAGDLETPLMPSEWTVLDELPKTLTGKIDRQALKQLSSEDENTLSPTVWEGVENKNVSEVIEEVWKRELNITFSINKEDDFFKNLGGDSLTCAVCCDQIEKRLGIQLPVGAAYTYTTLGTLSHFISKEREKAVFLIKLNEHQEDRPTLYFIPPYPGDRRTYYRLEEQLSSGFNLYFLFYNPILSSGEILSFSNLMDRMVALIEPKGDLNLTGFSFGGILAYFIALKLQKRQIKVNKLILIDSPTYQQLSSIERIVNFSERILRLVKRFIIAPQQIWTQYIINSRAVYKDYNEKFTSEKGKKNSLHPASIIWTYVQAFPAYEILDCDLVLFQVSERQPVYQFKSDFDWQRYTKSNFTRIGLNGWHSDALIDELNIEIIAEELKKGSLK
jgi:acyl-coenzyme A synthetase/AMP-(fatty) acid ligase/thioesterase domain-containing protein/acyl carrier protein